MKKLLTISMALIALSFAACKKTSTPATGGPKNKIVFVYKTDNSEGVSYKTLMEANGCSVTLIDKPLVAGYDFSAFNMIVIGNNSDVLGNTNWSSADSAAIQSSSKPVLLIGIGGYRLASKLKLTVNWNSSATETSSDMLVLNPASAIYKSPKTISVPANNKLNFYSASNNTVAFFTLLTTASIELIGKNPLSPEFSPVNYEGSRYGTFGYTSNMNNMTQTGKDFVVNLSYYVGKLML